MGDLPIAKKTYKDRLEKLGFKVFSLNYKYKGPVKADICMGHSFGGGRLMKNDVECALVFTFDAREWKFTNNDSYVSNHALHYNFFQTRGLRGYPIKKAHNFEIIDRGHMRLPEQSCGHVLEIIKRFKEGEL